MLKNIQTRLLYKTFSLLLTLTYGLIQSQALALTIHVTDANGNSVAGFRYIIEEDNSHPVTPGVPTTNNLSVGIHRSYAPIAIDNKGNGATGNVTGASIELDIKNNVPYIISVLPNGQFSNNSARIATDQELVTIVVHPLPLPTAQISILVFHDNSPLNNIPDLPQETGLAGFSVLLSDTVGQLVADVFGNPLGSRYQRDGNGNVVIGADGNPVIEVKGDGTITTDINGEALISNLAPGKYGVQIVSPAGQGWVQTNTIEGTPTIDAWVRAGEAAVFGEFGPPNKHVFFGFVQAFNNLAAITPAGTSTGSVTGRVVNAHSTAPPDFTFNNGHPLPECWVGLNVLSSRTAVIAKKCNQDSTFSIDGVPAGEYQLAVWDANLDLIFTIQGVTIPENGGQVTLGDIAVFRWFGYQQHYVFYDHNKNGFRDCFAPDDATPSGNVNDCDNALVDDIGIPGQVVNLRFRDGSMYQTFPTDTQGYVPFDEVFPFLKFLVAEVDFARFKATGATIVVDGGGAVMPDSGWDYPSRNQLTPQQQCESRDSQTDICNNPIININTDNNLSRTVTGPILTLATQTFLGLTNTIDWGKGNYALGENGGISGIIYYATTRAEDNPKYAAGDPWEPGIPRVQVALYTDSNNDQIVDDINGDGATTYADVDNFPFGNFPAVEDIDHNGNSQFNGGDAVQVTTSDSWDDNVPTNCQAPPFMINGALAQDCFEGLRTFNQVRDGVFDGGYAFNDYFPGGVDSGSTAQTIPPGRYIIVASTPMGYKHVKEEDKNVDFGIAFIPKTNLLPPACVGDLHLVPSELSLFPGIAAPYAGLSRPLCDRKAVRVSNGKNTTADFFMFTDVPKAARVVGLLLNDFANVFDPTHPSYGEKATPPWLPISIQDFTGKEIARIYSDQFGTYNALLPSSYTANVPSATGISPNMLRLCLNHPGPIPFGKDPGKVIPDPQFDPTFSQICYTADFWPGKTTYLDTPILPAAATAGRTDYPLDCEKPTATPVIHSVNGPQGGPYVPASGGKIKITSTNAKGLMSVPNPAYKAGNGTPLNVLRDYGFGKVPGTVSVGGVTLANVNWNDVTITATIPAGMSSGDLVITRGDNGIPTGTNIMLTVGGPAPIRVPMGGSIQATIDSATAGSIVMVPPGTYNELLIVWKSIHLQGAGAGSTIIDASKTTAAILSKWKARVANLIASGTVDLIPGQSAITNLEEGPGIFVIVKNGAFTTNPNARIDGFTIKNATKGGAILVNGYAANLSVSNNRIEDSQGNFGGGIRIGQPYVGTAAGNFVYSNAFNTDISITGNQIIKNGTRAQVGGGIALYTGSDGYRVENNFICGNFSAANGGGIGHLGTSDFGIIRNNTIIFNQTFQQTAGAGGAGGGIYISGGVPLGNDALTTGAGNISIDANIIQGNQAGADDGGGIMLRFINGQDTAAASASWYAVDVTNNIIVNNISGLAGALSLQDALKVNIVHNTIANNDSTATSASAFSGGISISTAQPAGVVSRANTPALSKAIAGKGFAAYSNPILKNNIIWQNRSFYWDVSQNGNQGGLVPDIEAGGAAVFSDLAVIGIAGLLNPQFSILTSTDGYANNNSSADPGFAAQYFNGGPDHLLSATGSASILTIPAFDEGGNFIDLSTGPLTLVNPVTGLRFGKYHLLP